MCSDRVQQHVLNLLCVRVENRMINMNSDIRS